MKLVKIGLILTALLTATGSFAAIDALEFKSAQQERDYHSLTQELRCPQCQNNNIADSNATIAVDMRAKVFDLLNEGKSKDEIVNYMVERYGNFVTYNPPLTPATILLWLLPLCFVVLGVFFIFRRKAKTTESAVENSAISSTHLSAEDEKRLQALLDKKD
ncbi:cytochrome c-type biogenesis protein [Actinobacillus porcinus]|uniref:cytochrome c-type biogenesis protein n=1 Tax=Actinobacillus porcinus TaxID=51048 RepID=UPI002355D860|nr:cytochrome c-type biogenesis protein [Actinobacillus porcinus]MCI5763734.1 cytochrome c-type biogenesis protein CcmH [Actinobacillus porcinus]MDY5421230.1 cytochrome c-type biogenesis protein [Actinobacillus porcinus]